jgi:hypothetical protein
MRSSDLASKQEATKGGKQGKGQTEITWIGLNQIESPEGTRREGPHFLQICSTKSQQFISNFWEAERNRESKEGATGKNRESKKGATPEKKGRRLVRSPIFFLGAHPSCFLRDSTK